LSTQIKSSAPSYPLITRERTEKLELLNHLIANLAHAIIICGPNGIGKTLLLKSFQNAAIDSWMFCFLKADNQLNLQKIQELLGETSVRKCF
jgi:DamX protein